ncbi:MAG: ribosome silencing factor [Spirochaetaceae bacterium]
MSENRRQVIDASELLSHHDGEDTLAIYVAEVCSFTDYLIITTARSSAHLRGLHRRLEEHLIGRNIRAVNSHKRSDGNGWTLLDYGFMVVHLMTEEMRDFYELERLWYNGDVVYDDRMRQDGSSV